MVKISVAMSAYNAQDHIGNAIESILAQTFGDFEFLLYDDGSSDNTLSIMRGYASDGRVRIIEGGTNRGLAYALNQCIAQAQGEYIARMDADDLSVPTRLQTQNDFLDANPGYSLVGSCMESFDDSGAYGVLKWPERPTKEDVFLHHGFAHATVMVRAEALRSVGGYTDIADTLRVEDYDLWCKLYFKGCVGYNITNCIYRTRMDRNTYSRRKYRFRINEFRRRKYWYGKLGIGKKYALQIFKPLIVGLIPAALMQTYHRKKWKAESE